jgi:hypothetical protein
VWRKGFGTAYTPDDFNDWRSHFGVARFEGTLAGKGAAGYPLGASAASLPAVVPEPATLAFLMLTICQLFCCFLARRDHATVL